MSRYVGRSDISGLFPDGTPGFRLLQGRMSAWNGTTLASTVNMLGKDYTDLPVLAGAVASMGTGITVLLAPFGTTHIIIDKIRTV